MPSFPSFFLSAYLSFFRLWLCKPEFPSFVLSFFSSFPLSLLPSSSPRCLCAVFPCLLPCLSVCSFLRWPRGWFVGFSTPPVFRMGQACQRRNARRGPVDSRNPRRFLAAELMHAREVRVVRRDPRNRSLNLQARWRIQKAGCGVGKNRQRMLVQFDNPEITSGEITSGEL